jgi:cyclomaltodextrinase
VVSFLIMTITATGRNVLFAYKASENVKTVSVVGTFNDWSAQKGRMKKAFGNVWMIQLDIPDGVYLYDFLVDGKLVCDPTNPKKKPNSQGGYYSILTVGTFAPPKGIAGDGVIHTNYVIFDNTARLYVNPASTNTVYFSIDTLKNDVNAVYLKAEDETYKMTRYDLNAYTDRYKIVFHPQKSKFNYLFVLKDGKTTLYYGEKGISSTPSTFTFDFSNPTVEILNAPTWAKGAIVYEIFPDRFFNGNLSNDPSYTLNWGGIPTYDNFFGGDLKGIIDKIDYLRELGINVLYTTPIFQSPSNHKYNTTDYLKIDPHFGTLKTFENLIGLLHSNNIRWVLDGVFNHTGTRFFAFQDILKEQKNSKYTKWYFIKRFPVNVENGDYATFQNYPSLPKLNTENPDVQRYLKKVVDYWMKKGVDGWRIDSANTISNDFLVKLYGWIHEDNPSSLDVGEIWYNASNWFYEGAFNSTMNYLFKDAAYSYIVYGADAKSFLQETNAYLNSYPPQLWNALWNLIDSHDTPRALTVLDGDLERMKLLVGLQMTFVGAPMIYYGDEIGLTGGKDPLNRGCMIWDQRKWNASLYEWYKKLINIRQNSRAIREGQYDPLIAKGQVFGFERFYEKEHVYVLLNASKDPQKVHLNLNGTFVNLLDDMTVKSEKNSLTISLKPYQMMILEKR